jgi:hypothetical protein
MKISHLREQQNIRVTLEKWNTRKQEKTEAREKNSSLNLVCNNSAKQVQKIYA